MKINACLSLRSGETASSAGTLNPNPPPPGGRACAPRSKTDRSAQHELSSKLTEREKKDTPNDYDQIFMRLIKEGCSREECPVRAGQH